ncbi:unnamed protein product [Arabidopsis thaliana]|uniref:(thale cress) hypothetical protein n=1 Tax=Arabidopsis thaliana TaxID=3702 RepID=A0A7G2FJQ3_ARATH|nr:unnamed protein product [Arabidopsis thaliana]
MSRLVQTMLLWLKSEKGFDTTEASDGPELQKSICDKRWSPCCTLVRLYARMGLHRYNLLKNLQLSRVKKYNMSTHYAACNYYITLVAMDPARSKLLNFQTKVDEERDLPKCPPEDIFENRKRFYVVEESKLQVNEWILLYLELAVATTHRSNGKYHDLSDLKIFESSEDVEPPNEVSLNVINVIVYIVYKDFYESRLVRMLIA